MNYSFIYQKNGYNIKPPISFNFISSNIQLIDNNLLKIQIDKNIQEKINNFYSLASKYRENKVYITDTLFAKVLFRYNKCVSSISHKDNDLVTIYDLKNTKVGEVNIKCNRYENGTLYFSVNKVIIHYNVE